MIVISPPSVITPMTGLPAGENWGRKGAPVQARFHCHRRISEGPAKVIPIEKTSIPIPKTYGWRRARGQKAVSRRKMRGTICR